MDSAAELKQALERFHSGCQWFEHPFYVQMVYSQGVKYFADHAGAHWFLDLVARCVVLPCPASYFLLITLRSCDGQAHLPAQSA